MTDDLVAFLRARLNEDEQTARAAGGDQWALQDHPSDTVAIYDSHRDPVVYDEGSPSEEQMEHIARNDPARVLAEVDAKRRIIAECESAYDQDSRGMAWMADRTLELLALPYRDHPDYQPEWAPDA